MKAWSTFRRRYQGYSGARADVASLISTAPMRVLDVGCGAGVMAELLRERYPGVHVTGIEPDPELSAHARKSADVVIQHGVDTPAAIEMLEGQDKFDLIICADVLEHLPDPEATLAALVSRMNPRGELITSLPNVRHVSTFFSLGVLGTWPARSRGIHDRTHLRFFARKDILQLGRKVGLEHVREKRNLRLIESAPWTTPVSKILDFWPLRGFFTFQYLHLWRRHESCRN